MKLTKNQLQSIIKEEYLRITPVKRGQVMSEARADYLAEQILQEGPIMSMLRAALGGAGEAISSALGGAFKPVTDSINSFADSAKKVKSDFTKFVGGIKDKALKDAVEKVKASLTSSLRNAIQSEVSAGMKVLNVVLKDEDQAKATSASILSAVLGELQSGDSGK